MLVLALLSDPLYPLEFEQDGRISRTLFSSLYQTFSLSGISYISNRIMKLTYSAYQPGLPQDTTISDNDRIHWYILQPVALHFL